jgi:hypothetical protein
MAKTDFYFIIEVQEDGTIQTHKEMPEDGFEPIKAPNTFDIYKVCREISSDIESQLLADRVIGGVLNVLNAREQSVSEKVADALKARGVEFEAGEKTVAFDAEDGSDK